MKSEWRDLTLGDIVEVKQGLAINAKSKHLIVDVGMPLLRITDLLNDNQVQFIDAKEAPLQCLANADDLIYTRTGQVGYVFRGKVGVVHNNCFRVIPKDENTTRGFLYWFLSQNSIRKYANNIASGSVQKDLNHAAFYSIPLSIPSKATQLKIETILNSIEDKIELNRKMNQTLETMAQALFKSWFVDFDPVHAKAQCSSDEELEAAARELGISKEVLGLFPSKFEESELGMIPKGWNSDFLDSFVEILDSKRIPLASNERAKRKGDVPYYGATSIMDYVDDYLFDETLLLMGEDGSVVRNDGTPFLQYIWGKAWVNNHAHVMKSKSSLSIEALYISLLNKNVTMFVTGAVQPKINQGNLKQIPIINAGESINKMYSTLIEPIFAKVRLITEENKTLEKTRDTLLPKLLSGELDVSELELDI
jgi:type I restriction enzyme, S subunit